MNNKNKFKKYLNKNKLKMINKDYKKNKYYKSKKNRMNKNNNIMMNFLKKIK